MNVEDLKRKPFEGSVNVAQLLKEPVGSRRRYHIDEVLDSYDEGLNQGIVTLTRTGQGILVQGELTLLVELVCNRCLNDFSYAMNFTIEEEFLQGWNGLPSPEGPDDVTVDSDNMLDLGEIIRQYAVLNLPMKALCPVHCSKFRR
jgi:uncharacterized protein